jgi:hypothetical protein
MSVRKAAYNRLAEKAVAGDAKALDFLLSLESAECPPQFDPPDAERSAAKDLEILQDFFNRRRAGVPQQEQDHDPERGLGKPKRGSK